MSTAYRDPASPPQPPAAPHPLRAIIEARLLDVLAGASVVAGRTHLDAVLAATVDTPSRTDDQSWFRVTVRLHARRYTLACAGEAVDILDARSNHYRGAAHHAAEVRAAVDDIVDTALGWFQACPNPYAKDARAIGVADPFPDGAIVEPGRRLGDGKGRRR